MRPLLVSLLVCAVLALSYAPAGAQSSALLDVLNATYLLHAKNYTCTAMAVKSDENGTYFLTARHCSVAESDDSIAEDVVMSHPNTPDLPVVLVTRGDTVKDDWALFKSPVQVAFFLPVEMIAKPEVGEAVTVAGYPYGIGPIVTQGAVSGVDVNTPTDFYPHSFAIYVFGAPGNSGSAVVDSTTEKVIGILFGAVVSTGAGGFPLIFAVPISDLSPDALQMIVP